jgi:hypothetical protein
LIKWAYLVFPHFYIANATCSVFSFVWEASPEPIAFHFSCCFPTRIDLLLLLAPLMCDPEMFWVQTAIPVGLDGSGPASGPSSMQLFPSDFGPTAGEVRRRNAAIAAENAEILRQKKAAEAAARATEAFVLPFSPPRSH